VQAANAKLTKQVELLKKEVVAARSDTETKVGGALTARGERGAD